MKNKHPHPAQLSATEEHLIQQLRKQPELMERFQHILAITATAQGPVRRADEIESLLIEEMRRLGKATMESWANRTESTLAEEFKQQEPSAVVRKKNADVVVRVRPGEGC